MQTWRCRIRGAPTPSLKNSKRIFCRAGRTFVLPAAGFREWQQAVIQSLGAARLLGHSRTSPCEVRITVVMPDKRRRDLDNMASSILDTLRDAGVLSVDDWTVVSRLSVGYALGGSKAAAGFDCEIIPIE